MSEVKRYDISCFGCMSMDECGDGAYVNYEDYAALETKCAALAAENAGLKAAAKETLAHWAAAEPGEMEQMMDKCMPNLRVAYCETPATDAILAEVRAQGVEMYAEHLTRKAIASGENKNHAYAYLAANFAAQLRKGGAV